MIRLKVEVEAVPQKNIRTPVDHLPGESKKDKSSLDLNPCQLIPVGTATNRTNGLLTSGGANKRQRVSEGHHSEGLGRLLLSVAIASETDCPAAGC